MLSDELISQMSVSYTAIVVEMHCSIIGEHRMQIDR